MQRGGSFRNAPSLVSHQVLVRQQSVTQTPPSRSRSRSGSFQGPVQPLTRQKTTERGSSNNNIATPVAATTEAVMSLEQEEQMEWMNRTFRSDFHRFTVWLSTRQWLNTTIILVILLNALTVAIQSETSKGSYLAEIIEVIDYVFLTIYTFEFLLKVYAEPKGYWSNGYNRFDFFILLVSYFLIVFSAQSSGGDFTFIRVIRALRALRALRSISFVRSLQVIVTALFQTLIDVLNILSLMTLIIFVFGVVGFYLWGHDNGGDTERWGTLPDAMWTLFAFVTADGWTDLQAELDDRGFQYARLYSIVFIFMGHFVFINLFIGVIIQNLDEATEEDRVERKKRRTEIVRRKKALVAQRQAKEFQRVLVHKNMTGQKSSMQDLLRKLAGHLRHDDVVPVRNLSCHLSWLETYLAALDHRENSLYKLQQLHFELATTLAELTERRLT